MNQSQKSEPSPIPEKASSDLRHLTLGYARFTVLYEKLLGRQPTVEESIQGNKAFASRVGMLKQMLVVGCSKEARRNRGWFGRLVRCAEGSSAGPKIIRSLLCRPVVLSLELLDSLVPGISGQPFNPTTTSNSTNSHPTLNTSTNSTESLVNETTQFTPGLTLVGYLSGSFGLGEAARSLAIACIDSGIPISGVDISDPSLCNPEDEPIKFPNIQDSPSIQLLYVNGNATASTLNFLKVAYHHEPRYRIGFWHWEQPKLPDSYLDYFNHLDEIWVPSTFVQDAVAELSPRPIYKVPHTVNFTPSENATRERFGLPRDKQLVLVMFNFYSRYQRKNPQAAIAAFRSAAEQIPSLGLVVKTQNGSKMPSEFAELKELLRDIPNAILIDDSFSRQQTWDLESCCDMLLSLHRAEGFGLGPAEMMLLGKPVIATGWSANMDFMNSENSMPVRYELKPLLEHVPPYIQGPCWAEADVEHAAWSLVRVAQDPALAQRIGNLAKHTIQTSLSPSAIGKRVADRLAAIERWQSRK